MGWTSFYVGSGYTNKYRKKYLDDKFTWVGRDKDGNETNRCELIKSAMVGSTYYGAVKCTRPDGYDKTVAVIVLTRVENGEFFYKDMDESMGPCKCKCPKGILALLSPLDKNEEFAKAWRDRCNEYHNKNRSECKAKIGDVYECTAPYVITWNFTKINKGDKFFAKLCDYGKRRKYYMIAKQDGDYFSTTSLQIRKSTFNSCEPKLIQRGV